MFLATVHDLSCFMPETPLPGPLLLLGYFKYSVLGSADA